MDQITQQLRPDAKGRINLGKLAQGVSSFRAHRTEEGNIILEPFTEIPARERWLFDRTLPLEPNPENPSPEGAKAGAATRKAWIFGTPAKRGPGAVGGEPHARTRGRSGCG
jgi:hypothetical protein